jgi:Kef-type K+ transport system membrane component KefB
MLFLLFIIGFNLEIDKMRKFGKEIAKGSLLIISLEAATITSILYFVFPAEVNNSLLVALITALSFATVGEAILVPILAKFNLIKTNFGQLTLGIGTLDDILEVLTILLLPFLPTLIPNIVIQGFPDPMFVILDLIGITVVTVVFVKVGNKIRHSIKKNGDLDFIRPLGILLVFFAFIAFGGFVFESLMAVSAIFGGIAVKEMLPKEKRRDDENNVNFVGYVLLAPIFFLGIGSHVSLDAVVLSPLLLVMLWLGAKGSKLLASYLLFNKSLGKRHSLLMGLGLSIRFSTGLIVQFALFSCGLISIGLYSTLVLTAVLMKPVVLIIYSQALAKNPPQ